MLRARDHFQLSLSEAANRQDRLIASVRTVFAFAGLVVIAIDPPGPAHLVTATYVCLVAYAVYSIALYLLTSRPVPRAAPVFQWAHWADVAWFTMLIVLSNGAHSIFFYSYFFPILTAASRWGFRPGANVTLASFALFTTLGYATGPADGFELNRYLIRPIYLLLFGYLISYLGDYQVSLKRQLCLLRDVTTLSNPRFGVDRTVAEVVKRLRSFFEASLCVVVAVPKGTDRIRVRRCPAEKPDEADALVQMPATALGGLLRPPASEFVYGGPGLVSGHDRDPTVQNEAAVIADLLGARSFMTVPWSQHGDPSCRVYVASRKSRAYDSSDLQFLTQVLRQVTPTLDNVRLVDRMASDAADAERQRIALDLHDSVVQPYIGVRLGLHAVRRKLGEGADIAADLERLDQMLDSEIHDLRHYLALLKSVDAPRNALAGALQRFVERFSSATAITVSLEIPEQLPFNDRLAAEVFQFIEEALANVRKHSTATDVRVRLEAKAHQLLIQVEEMLETGAMPSHFVPRSLSERAAALGGWVNVLPRAAGGSIVAIQIPL